MMMCFFIFIKVWVKLFQKLAGLGAAPRGLSHAVLVPRSSFQHVFEYIFSGV